MFSCNKFSISVSFADNSVWSSTYGESRLKLQKWKDGRKKGEDMRPERRKIVIGGGAKRLLSKRLDEIWNHRCYLLPTSSHRHSLSCSYFVSRIVFLSSRRLRGAYCLIGFGRICFWAEFDELVRLISTTHNPLITTELSIYFFMCQISIL
jgi:hypothetical protein